MKVSSEKYLVVKGCAGLGNRLFTICAAIDFAIKTSRILVIDWTDGQFGIKGENVFNKYFKIQGIKTLPNLTDIPNFQSLSCYPEVWQKHPEYGVYNAFLEARHKLLGKLPSQLLVTKKLKMLKGFWLTIEKKTVPKSVIAFCWELFNNENLPFGNSLSLNHSEDVVFYVDFVPQMNEQVFFKHLKLKNDIEEKIKQFADSNQLSVDCIGVHVRFSDKKPDNTIESLFAKITSIGVDKTIFLATDNSLIVEKFKQKFKKVIQYPKFQPAIGNNGLHQWALYNNKIEHAQQILKESIIDMWLLSKCEYLVYQGNSSFSRISKLLHIDAQKTLDWNIN